MEWASICGSDIHRVFDGMHEPNRIGAIGYPGHEGIGTVVAHDGAGVSDGDVVLTVPAGPVGSCFAEFQVFDGSQLVAAPAAADRRRTLMAQQLGTTIFALRRFLGAFGDRVPRTVAVLGAGSAGLYFVQLLRRLGVERIAVAEPHPERAGLAADLGAALVTDGRSGSLSAAVERLTGGAGAELVIEAAGYDMSRAEAVEAVGVGGVVGCFGFPERLGAALFPVQRAFRKAVQVHFISGTQSEPGLRSFVAALDLITSSQIEIDYCLQACYPLPELPDAMAVARRRGAVKVNIEIGG